MVTWIEWIYKYVEMSNDFLTVYAEFIELNKLYLIL